MYLTLVKNIAVIFVSVVIALYLAVLGAEKLFMEKGAVILQRNQYVNAYKSCYAKLDEAQKKELEKGE